MKNILVTSLGTSWSIIPELIGFTNPEQFDFYRNHPAYEKIKQQRIDFDILPVEEVWVATTNGKAVKTGLETLKKWIRCFPELPEIRLFSYTNLLELNSIDEIAPMSDLIYRVVLHAKKDAGEGKVYLSLAGGRKNMSSDIQNAAYIFGTDALIHLMADEWRNVDDIFKEKSSYSGFFKMPGKKVNCFYPVVMTGKIASSPFLFVEPLIKAENYSLDNSLLQKEKTDLFEEISKRQRQSANSLLNIYKKRTQNDLQTNYTVFHLLKPEIVNRLQSEIIGLNFSEKEKDLSWLRKIPKAELHCHLGGILSPAEMIEVALELEDKIRKLRNNNYEFDLWLKGFEKAVTENNVDVLPEYKPKEDRKYWSNKEIKEPYAIAGILTAFKNNPDLLERYIYKDTGKFKGLGIDHYEKLGDLQGSSLLQTEETIRKTCLILKEQCRRENIRYIEVRCSPENYTRGGLTGEDVVNILLDELQDNKTIFKLLFIASRHGDKSFIQKHIRLALNMRKENKLFRKMFVGFDLAGSEAAKSPKKLREVFMDILKESIPTTIHAGENKPVKNIWEAVYHLSAERIGHGLTLNEDPGLQQRLKERKTAIEMCPTSNDQIVGYRDFCSEGKNFSDKVYPLKQYLKEGLKVTVNTDDPGISLTNLTQEYYKAACMTEGGLSKWKLLQINRNGFKYAFLSLEEKKRLLSEAEEELYKLLTNE